MKRISPVWRTILWQNIRPSPCWRKVMRMLPRNRLTRRHVRTTLYKGWASTRLTQTVMTSRCMKKRSWVSTCVPVQLRIIYCTFGLFFSPQKEELQVIFLWFFRVVFTGKQSGESDTIWIGSGSKFDLSNLEQITKKTKLAHIFSFLSNIRFFIIH